MQPLSPADTDAIAARLRALRQQIADLAERADRSPTDIRLIAVSKTHAPAAIAAAHGAGQIDFGESTMQEALAKLPSLADLPLTWHFIGHLQSNKARFIAGNFAWLHSLDSLPLAQRLSRLAVAANARVDALIEVNIARDPRKHGVLPEALAGLLESILAAALPNLGLRGLMAIGPHPAHDAASGAAFAAVHRLRDECRDRFGLADFSELSMGMSGDFAAAIREGATMLRLGSAIFGERDYPARA